MDRVWQLVGRLYTSLVANGARASPRITLRDLPDPAVAALVAFLDTHTLRVAALCCRDELPALADAFRCRFVLRLPPDTARNWLLMRAVAQHASSREAVQTDDGQSGEFPTKRNQSLLATQFVVADTVQAAELLPARHDVSGLVISTNEYTAWPTRDARWEIVAQFVALERLVIDHVWDRPLDLVVLSQNAPQLQELVIKRARNLMKHLVALTKLRVLHVEDTNIDSLEIAVGLPKLQSLALLLPPHSAHEQLIGGVACLADIAPLTKLTIRGVWERCPRATLHKHHSTLREYAELNEQSNYKFHHHRFWHPDWPVLINLRSLRLGRHAQTDVEPLAVLIQLEHLQLELAKTCVTCVPLRRLAKMRTLQISNGWVCDLVGHLPRLEKLVWQTGPEYPLDDTGRLWRRYDRAEDDFGSYVVANEPARLRELVLYGNFQVEFNDPHVERLLRFVEHLEISGNTLIQCSLPSLARLRHLKRLAIGTCFIPWVPHVGARRVSWACAESLEELFYAPGLYYDNSRKAQPAPLPHWIHDRLPNLRVLASPYDESMEVLSELCPGLTHLHLPFSGRCNFPITNRDSLSRLCVVTLALKYDCAWLRRERGPRRALPMLQRIFHPTTDCLSSPTQCERLTTVAHERSCAYDVFVGAKTLRSAWCHG